MWWWKKRRHETVTTKMRQNSDGAYLFTYGYVLSIHSSGAPLARNQARISSALDASTMYQSFIPPFPIGHFVDKRFAVLVRVMPPHGLRFRV
jgi:hypothetical protein